MVDNLGLDPLGDTVDHFGAPWWPFWILQTVRHCRRRASAPGGARLVFHYDIAVCQSYQDHFIIEAEETHTASALVNSELGSGISYCINQCESTYQDTCVAVLIDVDAKE